MNGAALGSEIGLRRCPCNVRMSLLAAEDSAVPGVR